MERTVRHITVNGQTYKSVDEMPPDVRTQYEKILAMLPDENRDGVPDILEQPAGKEKVSLTRVSTFQKYIVNGKEYERLEDVPEPLREMIQTAGGTLKAHSDVGYRAAMSLETRSGDDGITLRISRGMLVFIVIVLVVAAVLTVAYFM